MLQAEFQKEKNLKNGFEKARNFSWRSVTTLSAFELRQNWGTHEIQLEVRFIQNKWADIVGKGCANNVKILLHHIRDCGEFESVDNGYRMVGLG